MLFSPIHFFVIATFLLLTNTCAIGVVQREPCSGTYTQCSPPGATNSIVPPAGDALAGLYFDLVGSVNPQPVIRDAAADQAPDQNQDLLSDICCTQGTECRLLQSFSLPFCWDRFTTNFFLPDGSFGNIFTGHYSASSGAIVNLVSGNIALPDGQVRNIYADIPQAKPATSLLPVPTPWTSAGVGTAIPDSQLGSAPTYAVTLADNTVDPTNIVSFPSVTSTDGPTRTPGTLNITGFPTYATASTGGSYGYGPPPAPNTTTVEPSTGSASDTFTGSARSMLYLLVLVSLMLNLLPSACFGGF